MSFHSSVCPVGPKKEASRGKRLRPCGFVWGEISSPSLSVTGLITLYSGIGFLLFFWTRWLGVPTTEGYLTLKRLLWECLSLPVNPSGERKSVYLLEGHLGIQ